MKKILIVDDDVYIGNMIEELLQQEGYGVANRQRSTASWRRVFPLTTRH